MNEFIRIDTEVNKDKVAFYVSSEDLSWYDFGKRLNYASYDDDYCDCESRLSDDGVLDHYYSCIENSNYRSKNRGFNSDNLYKVATVRIVFYDDDVKKLAVILDYLSKFWKEDFVKSREGYKIIEFPKYIDRSEANKKNGFLLTEVKRRDIEEYDNCLVSLVLYNRSFRKTREIYYESKVNKKALLHNI